MKTALFLSLILVLFSCKKEKEKDETKDNQWAVPKIKTRILASSNTAAYAYDKEGRITQGEEGDYRTEFFYEPAKVNVKTTDITSGGVETRSYDLNDEGYLTKWSNSNTSYNYTYTPEGYIKNIVITSAIAPIRVSIYYYNGTTKLLDSIVKTDGPDWSQTTIYTYYTGKMETTGNENLGRVFYGRSMPHPIHKVTYWEPKTGIPNREIIRTESNEYQYNEAGWIVRRTTNTTTYGQADPSVSTIYTYY